MTKFLLRPAEAADALGVSLKTLFNFTAPRGPIRCIRLGRKAVRYEPDALREAVAHFRETVEG